MLVRKEFQLTSKPPGVDAKRVWFHYVDGILERIIDTDIFYYVDVRDTIRDVEGVFKASLDDGGPGRWSCLLFTWWIYEDDDLGPGQKVGLLVLDDDDAAIAAAANKMARREDV